MKGTCDKVLGDSLKLWSITEHENLPFWVQPIPHHGLYALHLRLEKVQACCKIL
jgi:hypothetical protein